VQDNDHDEYRHVDADASPADDEYAFATDKPSTPKQPTVSIKLQATTVNLIIDTGASVNILDESTLCPKKNDTAVTHYRFNPHQPISVIFGRDVAERVCY